MTMTREEIEWEVLIEAELRSPEEYLGQAEDRLMTAMEDLGFRDRVVVGGGSAGELAVRLLVLAESVRVAMDRGVAIFDDAVAKSGLDVGDLNALEIMSDERPARRPAMA